MLQKHHGCKIPLSLRGNKQIHHIGCMGTGKEQTCCHSSVVDMGVVAPKGFHSIASHDIEPWFCGQLPWLDRDSSACPVLFEHICVRIFVPFTKNSS